MMVFAQPTFAKNVKINVVTDANGCPALAEPDQPCSSGSEDVCFNTGGAHKITWKYKSDPGTKKPFGIVMKNPADSAIFVSGCSTRGKSFSCNLKTSAYVGDYAYSIVVDSTCAHDPKIIINP